MNEIPTISESENQRFREGLIYGTSSSISFNGIRKPIPIEVRLTCPELVKEYEENLDE